MQPKLLGLWRGLGSRQKLLCKRAGKRLIAGAVGVGTIMAGASYGVTSAFAETETPDQQEFHLRCVRKSGEVQCSEVPPPLIPGVSSPSSEPSEPPTQLAHPRALPEDPNYMPNLYNITYAPAEIAYTNHKEGTLYVSSPAIPPDQQTTDKAMGFLLSNINWQERSENHLTAWYTDRGWEIGYEYDIGKIQPWNHMPPWMLQMRDHMMETLNLPRDNPPNSCNMNWYRNGEANIGAHQDNETLFDAVEHPTRIISFTMGAERPFEVWDFDKTGIVKSQILKNGAYCIMEGRFQTYLRHAVPKVEGLTEPRFNLTWRWIMNKDSGRKPVEFQSETYHE